MKAEFVDHEKGVTTNTNMFSKFHHQHQTSSPQKFQSPLHPTPQYLHETHRHHQFHHLTKDSQTSEEADSATPTTTTTGNTASTNPSAPSPKKPRLLNTNEDGATIEVIRRPRGRPPGSKNKPKPPVVITREPDPSMAPYILEVAGGVDIIDSLTRFTRRRSIGLCVLTASGTVANVTLKQPSAATNPGGGTVTFHGRFHILSLSAVLLGGGGGAYNGNNHGNGYSQNGLFTISFAGPQGQVVGGKVVGALLAAGTVFVMAASFDNPSYHRLPVDNNDDVHRSVSAGGYVNDSSPGVSGGGGSGGGGGGGAGGHPAGAGGAGGESLG
ncbi:hypothetical protein Dimus_006256 [Dionaea muscipula]